MSSSPKGKKRSLDAATKKDSEPPKKRVRIAEGTKSKSPKGKPAVPERLWTHTNPDTGESDGRLHRKDAVYQKHQERRKKKKKAPAKKKGKQPAKEKKPELKRLVTDAMREAKNKKPEEVEYADLAQRFEGHICVVTGAGEGIGSSVAVRLAQEGASVYVTDNKKWVDTVNLCKKHSTMEDAFFIGQKLDVRDAKAVKKFIDGVLEKHDYLDVVVNAAFRHTGEDTKAEEVDAKDIDTVMSVQFMGAFNVCQAALPHMRKEGYGRIVNVVSCVGQQGEQGQMVQAAASNALIGATKSMAKEVAKDGVTVNCVMYSYVDYGQLSAADKKAAKDTIPVGRPADLGEVAGAVAWAASEENSYSTGSTIDCTGGALS